MAIAERHGDQLQTHRFDERKVQLAMGLDECNHLSSAVIDRGIECLTRFAGRLGDVNNSRLRVVATNTLRRAVNSKNCIVRANDILPVHIEIISGTRRGTADLFGCIAHLPKSSAKVCG